MDLNKRGLFREYFDSIKVTNTRKGIFFFWFLVLLSLILIKAAFIEYSLNYPTTEKLLDILLQIFFIYFLIDLVVLLWTSSYRVRNRLPKEHYDNFTVGLTMSSYILKTIIIIGLIFYTFDINVEVFFTTLALFSVALAWLFKEYVDNLIDGMLILFSQDFKIKDYIKVEDIKGRVTYISLQSTQLKTDEGDLIFVPNTVLLEKPVINYSKAKTKTIDYNFELPYSKFKNLEKFEAYLKKKVMREFDKLLDDERIKFKINEITFEKVAITLSVPVLRYNFEIEERIKKFVSLEVIRYVNGSLKV